MLPHLLADIGEGFTVPPQVLVRLFSEAAPSACHVLAFHAPEHGVGPYPVHEYASHERALFSGEVLESSQSAGPVSPLESLKLGPPLLDGPGLQPSGELEHEWFQMLIWPLQHRSGLAWSGLSV
eukprot:2561071-Alexandrium_andersonii.AAC.1